MMDLRLVTVCTCEKCGREFIPRTCPSCKSPNWNKDSEANEAKVSEMPKPETLPETHASPIEEEVIPGPPDIELSPEQEDEIAAEKIAQPPITRRSAPKRQAIGKQKKKTTKLGSSRCQHGFMIVDGVTACKDCR